MCLVHEVELRASVKVKQTEKLTDKPEAREDEPETISSLLNNYSLEELRENAVGRHLVEDTKARKMTRNELVKLLEPFARGMNSTYTVPLHPFSPPSTTLGEVRSALPPHLFKRSLFRALSIIVLDICMVLAIFYAGTFIEKSGLHPVVKGVLWCVYWYWQSMHFCGLWVMSHEAGHNAISEWESLDDVIGWVLHSFLQVPYFSWKISHRKHHSNTGSAEHDDVFAPDGLQFKDSEAPAIGFLAAHLELLLVITTGWPLYLWFNICGPSKYPKRISSSHFVPWSPLFDRKDAMAVIISDIGLIIVYIGLYLACQRFGLLNVFNYYFVPYLGCNAHMIIVTYLQHTDVFMPHFRSSDRYMPHFRSSDWQWFKGALCTIDRSYGSIVDHTIHHATDTHVCHHVFSRVPQHNAQEVTVILSKMLGKHFTIDKTPTLAALERSWLACRYVDSDKKQNVLFHRSR